MKKINLHIFIMVSVIILCPLPHHTMNTTNTSSDNEVKFSVMIFNFKEFPPWKDDEPEFPAITYFLRDIKPQIIGMQEFQGGRICV